MPTRCESSLKLALEVVDGGYRDLMREAHGGYLPSRVYVPGSDSAAELRDLHRWLVEHGEEVARDAVVVLERALAIEADEDFERD